jgi:hypothetical protein
MRILALVAAAAMTFSAAGLALGADIEDENAPRGTFSVDAGNEVNVGSYSFPLSSSCANRGVTVTVTTAPQHGKIVVRTGDFTYSTGPVSNCLGKTVSGSQVFYKADANYKGADHFDFTVLFQLVKLHKAVDITVN